MLNLVEGNEPGMWNTTALRVYICLREYDAWLRPLFRIENRETSPKNCSSNKKISHSVRYIRICHAVSKKPEDRRPYTYNRNEVVPYMILAMSPVHYR